jgi:hypothetical protein
VSAYTSTYPATYQGSSATGSFTIDVGFPVLPKPKGPWRFVYGPPQPVGGITAEILQAQNKTLTLRTEPGQNHQCSFDVDGRSPAAADIIELETDMMVLFGDKIVFDGRVGDSQDTLTAGAHRTVINAYDYREVLRRRAILPGDTVSWTNKDRSDIAWAMIQATQGRPGGNLGISRGLDQDLGGQTYTAQLGDYIGDDIDSLAQLDPPFEWQINPYSVADLRFDVYSPELGTDNGVVITYGDNRIAQITRKVDPSSFADAVYVTSSASVSGTKTLTPQHLESSDIGTRPEQRWDAVFGNQDQTQATLNADAMGLLNSAQVVVPSYEVVLHPGAWDGPDWLFLGDVVTLQISSGRLQVNEKLRVVEMSFAISPDGIETLTLTIGAIPFKIHKKIASMIRHLRYLDTR